jgi:hypothetical protein
MTEYIKHKVADAISLTVTDTGKTMAQRIADETCKLLESKIDEVITKITDGTLDKLRRKIDSEEFSEKFVNVLQQKLIDGQPPDDPFLNKFIKLFDNVIEKAINNYGKPINIPPKDIVSGITDYLQNSVPDFWESNGQKLYTEAVDNVLVDFNKQQNQSQSAFISALREAVVKPSILGQVTFNSALYDTIEKYKTSPNAPVVAEAVPESDSSKDASLAAATPASPVSPLTTANPEPPATPLATATPVETISPEVNVNPLDDAKKGGRNKRTRKVSRKLRSRRNRPNRAKRLTKRNLFL